MIQPWTVVAGGARLGVAVGRQATRPVAGVVAAGRRAGARLALDVLDAVLASPTTEVATDRVLARPWAERTVSNALAGPLVDVAAREVAHGAVLERVLDEVLATEVLDHIADRAEQAGRSLVHPMGVLNHVHRWGLAGQRGGVDQRGQPPPTRIGINGR